MSLISSIPVTQPQALSSATPLSSASGTANGSGLSFGDVLDTINPLQHIPVLSGLWRAATGSSISTGAQIAGDTLYGGIFGVGSAIASLASSSGQALLQQQTGESLSQHVLATLGLTGSSSAVAGATPLTADSPGVTLALANAQAAQTATATNTPLVAALNNIYHSNDMTRSSALYQSAQMNDATSKMLVKMAV